MISYVEHYEHTQIAKVHKEKHDKSTEGKIFFECLTITGRLKTYTEIPFERFVPKPSYSSYKKFIYKNGTKVYLDNYMPSIELKISNNKVLKGHIENNFFKGLLISPKKEKYLELKINKYNCITYSKQKICIERIEESKRE